MTLDERFAQSLVRIHQHVFRPLSDDWEAKGRPAKHLVHDVRVIAEWINNNPLAKVAATENCIKTLKSAIANAEDLKEHKKEYAGLKTERLVIKEALAQTASTLRRFTPKARGSAGPILKRNCHIKIVLSDE
jgi:hypothetical protein